MDNIRYRDLTPEEEHIIRHKGTEAPFSGEYESHFAKGIYHCKQCDAPLYESRDKFHSHCGWPAFDDEIDGAILRKPDSDGRRVEILCAHCGGHLGHLFKGEGFTEKGIRHCVNSLSLIFKPLEVNKEYRKAFFAAGCFWGVEYLFRSLKGVVRTRCGYMGGVTENPTYKEVCYTASGHLEVVEILYDPQSVTYDQLLRHFFEIHDPTQIGGQGPDMGEQYLSAIFTDDAGERENARELMVLLEKRGLTLSTTIRDLAPFWEAEEYHQDYYVKSGKQPYCHVYTKRF